MVRSLRVLIAEDNPLDAELVLRELRRGGFEPVWVRVDCEAEYLRCLDETPELILSDYDMPQFSGLRALELLNARQLDIPLLIVSGTIGEETAVAAMRDGAADYLMKDRLGRLGPAVTHALEQSRLRRERRQNQIALAESESRFRQLAENINEVFWITDASKSRMLYVSPAYETVWGRSCASLLSDPSTWLKALHPDDHDRVLEAVLTKQLAGSYDEEYRILRPDGGVRWIRDRAFPVAGPDGVTYRIVGVSTDITPRRRAEEALRSSEERLRMLIENTSDIIVLIDIRGVLHFHSPSVERLLGYRPDQWLGRSVLEFVHEEDRDGLRSAIAKARLSPELPFTVECRMQRSDGGWRVLQSVGKQAGQRGGEPVIVVSARDVTEHRQLEEQFLRVQRMEAIGSLASGVAHDLNNILAPVLMGAGLLKECLARPEDLQLLDMIEQASRRGADIVRQLLTFSRGVEGTRVPVQVRHLLKEMLTLMRETFPREITIEADLPTELPPVRGRGDVTQFHQVLMNLCVNARDAMPGGGRLALAAAVVEVKAEEAARQHGVGPGLFVQLSIRDTGTGIPPAIIDRIFDPFFTTKGLGKGTGLGLSTVLGIVRSHHGFITVDSAPGRGTEFRVFLPAEPETELLGEVAESLTTRPGENRLVLVVDDEPALRETIRLVLENEGYRVVCAMNGLEGLAVLAHQAQEIDLVVTDLMMPEMNGAALIRALRSTHPTLPVVAMSGQVSNEIKAELVALGLDSILMKPFVPGHLLLAMDRAREAGR